jgi:hypothetical protein
MKANVAILRMAAAAVLCVSTAWSQDALIVHPSRTASGLLLSWSGAMPGPDGSTIRPVFELQHSLDLRTWTPVGNRVRATAESPSAWEEVLPIEATQGFYRLLAVLPREGIGLASSGEEALGYGAAFAAALADVGQITPDEFRDSFANDVEYRSGINWDPTSAQFWDLFAINPEVYNQGLIWGVDDVRLEDWRLKPQELAGLRANGFVVSERLGSHSFADLFYKLWKDDLPVFVSTDALLQAWHRTFDMMLEEIEETFLHNSMEQMLTAMAAQVPEAWAQAGNTVLAESLLDADYFLAVARALLAESGDRPGSVLGQDARVRATLGAVEAEQLEEFDLFGACRMVDYSQFKVRGHYEHSERLGRYFQCLTWLGRIDFRIAGGPFQDCPGREPRMASPREMAGAIVLWHLLRQSGQFESWRAMDRTIQTFVGWSDSMTFAQLEQVLTAAEINSLADVSDLTTIEQIQQQILEGELGAQNIRSDHFFSPLGPGQVILPRSFTVFGQRFTPDSWALKNVVFDDVLWTANDVTVKICRRIPSALDVAFGVLGNDQIVPEIFTRITNPDAGTSTDPVVRLRDGMPYQHNLAAVRRVIDQQTPEAWAANLYLNWLDTLRILSAPTTDVRYPEAMRTRAWAMKTLNTQLASWTHLRHDTILYTKQSYTSGGECSYPAGYVEPRPEFWARLRQMALCAHSLIGELEYPGQLTFPITQFSPGMGGGRIVIGEQTVPLTDVQAHQLEHLQRFADTAAMLEAISHKELAQACLNDEETDFLRDLVEEEGWLPWGGSEWMRTYDGWYPQLFYRKLSEADDAIFHANRGAEAFDAVVTDVHTDVPSEYPGCFSSGHVLHEGVGRVHLLMIAIESGEDRMVFAGPVLSHYEFAVDGIMRLSDNEWRWGGAWDAVPNEWTKSYLVRP